MLPLKAAYFIAEIVTDIQCFFAVKDREAVAGNLKLVLNKEISECRAMARNVFRNFGYYLVDFFRLGNLDKKTIQEKVKFIGLENIDNVLKEKRGIILLSCHIGNWEMGGVVMGILGYKINAVALNHKHERINKFFINQREKKGMKVITIDSMMKRCVSVLRHGELLALLGDRDFTNSGITLDFFGMPTSIPKGPAILSLMTGVPIIPGLFVRDGKFNYKFIFETPIYIKEKPGVDKDEVIKDASREFVHVMERVIKTYPDQWMVFRKFWETPVNINIM